MHSSSGWTFNLLLHVSPSGSSHFHNNKHKQTIRDGQWFRHLPYGVFRTRDLSMKLSQHTYHNSSRNLSRVGHRCLKNPHNIASWSNSVLASNTKLEIAINRASVFVWQLGWMGSQLHKSFSCHPKALYQLGQRSTERHDRKRENSTEMFSFWKEAQRCRGRLRERLLLSDLPCDWCWGLSHDST